MNEHVWADTYTRAVHLFDGQTPGRQLEASLIEKFEKHPEAVEAAIDKIGARFQDGKITSPWPIVLRELETVDRTTIIADGKQERAKRIRQAEAWIRNAGLHAPTEAEVTHELYEARTNGHQHSSQALLAPWADDDVLRQRMLTLWREVRPLGEQVDREAIERAERWNRARELMLNPAQGGGAGS